MQCTSSCRTPENSCNCNATHVRPSWAKSSGKILDWLLQLTQICHWSLKTYESRLWQRNTRWQCDVRMTFEVAQPFSPTWACHSSDILLLQRLWRVYILEPNDIQDKHNTYTANRHTQCPGIQSYLALSSKSIKITLFVWFKIHQSSAAAECWKLKF